LSLVKTGAKFTLPNPSRVGTSLAHASAHAALNSCRLNLQVFGCNVRRAIYSGIVPDIKLLQVAPKRRLRIHGEGGEGLLCRTVMDTIKLDSIRN
jgi:hypothetical protein